MRRSHRDGLWAALGLLLLLLWEASGADLAVVRTFGSAAGFVWRDGWWARGVLHQGGRFLSWLVFFGLAAQAVRVAYRRPAGPDELSARARLAWLAIALVAVAWVGLLKHQSLTSCPWDLAEFGGRAQPVSHWRALLLGQADGGPGGCFPSGHAVSAFTFFTQYFLWREHRPDVARAWLVGVWIFGLLFGAAQLVRGAHYPSHTLWSAWLCWVLCAAATTRAQNAREPTALPARS